MARCATLAHDPAAARCASPASSSPGRKPIFLLGGDVEASAGRYRRGVFDGSPPESAQTDQPRRLVPLFALLIAIVAAVFDPSSAADVPLAAVPAGAFAVWAYLPRVPLPALSLAVVVPVVVAQRDGLLEPLLFEVSLLAFVVGFWARSRRAAVGLGLLALTSPLLASLIQNPSQIFVGIWMMGTVFPWVIARVAARERRLAAELEANRRALADQAVLSERRRIARDVHDFVGHGLAAVMLQITGARHVLRRDPAAAEEALRSAEELGRRSMQELRRTVALLRSDDEAPLAPPLPSVGDIPVLVDDARAGGLAVELETRGNLSGVSPNVGVALYRISQEALANAARHAPGARTLLGIEAGDGHVSLVAETTGPTLGGQAMEPERRRYGVVGMQERAKALGGDLVAGPTPQGWRVTCRLPLEARAPTPAAETQRR